MHSGRFNKPDNRLISDIDCFEQLSSYLMLKEIRMPVIVKGLCGATIGFLVGLYIANTFFGGAIGIFVLFCVALGAAIGIWLLRR